MTRLSIDGIAVDVEGQATLLDAALAAGITLPTLCQHKSLLPYGACRLCIVEVAGRQRLVPACSTQVEEGLDVLTASPRVVASRRLTLSMLRLRCPDVPKIQELCDEWGVEQRIVDRLAPGSDDCILCGLCTRICRERMGVGAIDFVGRGAERRVAPPFDEFSDTCMACGACEAVCPTASIHLQEITSRRPAPVLSEYNAGLEQRSPIYIPFPQAIPKVPVIDRESCAHFLTGECKTCEAACGPKAIDFDQQDELLQLDVGAVILTSGAEVIDPAIKAELGYGRYPNVISSIQFERLLSASGPTLGAVTRPSDGQHPKRIAFIQCVGSREIDRQYCSSVCCMYATKEAIIVKEHEPKTECTIFYIDLRAYGKGFEAYVQRAKELGVRYIRCRPSAVREDARTHDLALRYQKEGGGLSDESFDLVVLSMGLRPTREALDVARMLGIAANAYGFAQPGGLAPVETTRPGIYVAGTFSGPKDIPESVMEASGAASQVLGLLAGERGSLVAQRSYPPERDVAGEAPRVGVFVCHCGRNIAATVNVKDVAQYARDLAGVVYVEDNMYTCSTDAQQVIRAKIEELGLNRIVVASCTPRTHEPLFQDTLRQAGLNPYLFEMANIRDQCSWVHMHEPDAATRKAKDLVRMAVAKARLLEPLHPASAPVTPAGLVIGGGAAGLTAALDLANQGFHTVLLERSGELGGIARRLRFLSDGADPRPWLHDLIGSVVRHPRIEVFTQAEVVSLEGTVGNFRTTFTFEGAERVIEHGAVIVATGAEEYRPEEYLYGEDARVMTQLELEARLEDPGFDPKAVVMIQCVGSRGDVHGYCSRVCCTEAIKNALLLKAKNPRTAVYILNRDIRTYGYHEAEYRKAREAGVKFIRYAEDRRPEVSAEASGLSVRVEDLMLGMQLDIPCDAVILAAATVPPKGNARLGQQLKVPLNEDGFFLEAHMKLRPVDFSSDGIFLCGLAHSPKSLPESIAQASGAAARAATLLAKTAIDLEPRVSEVVDENCDGCAYCIDTCPYHALSLIEYVKDGTVRKVAESDPSRCRGCGVCMATCPKNGIRVRNFTLDQISAMVEAALTP